ncbi:hypothetical protein L484_023558 [Morus notabilis]|uniref:DIRP domain-containing protein n=1 Tax=Morus notabilis TaxID=981085 RepID=W9R711_9ROSA|nr:hypothetical protein L484_023558 [Morus notabilis]
MPSNSPSLFFLLLLHQSLFRRLHDLLLLSHSTARFLRRSSPIDFSVSDRFSDLIGIVSHAVRKRTPRVPISHPDNDVSPAAKQNVKLKMDASDDDVAHEIAMVLTEASQRNGTPHVSRMANRKPEAAISSPHQDGERMRTEPEITGAKFHHTNFQDGHCKKLEVEDDANDYLDNMKEGCTGKEKQNLSAVKRKTQTEIMNVESPRSLSKGLRKRSRKSLFGKDEDSPFDALQTLADLSLMMPSTISPTESSAKGKEDKTKVGSHVSDTGIQKRRQKSFPQKIRKASDEAQRSVFKGKRSSHNSAHQGKSVKPLDHTSSDTNCKREVNDSASLMTEVPSRDQLTKSRSVWKTFVSKDTNSPVQVLDGQPNIAVPSLLRRELNPKKSLSNFLSRYQARRWCAFEWFYSVIDYPWFAKSEFIEYLNHVGMGHVPRLTRVEWGVIKGSLGKPRRFSEHFLKEEKGKLNQYRESVRTHYAELRTGTREGLPTDLARPLSVGQRVIAIHPRTREMHNGTVLTVDHSRYHVQFDQPDLGVEFVMDIECMPLNPTENIPASFRKRNPFVNNFFENLKELKINEQLKGGKTDEYIKAALSLNQNNNDRLYVSPSSDDVEEFLKCKEVSGSFSLRTMLAMGKHLKIASEPPSVSQIRAKEADVQAVSELTRALDKKEAVVFELKRMNDEIFEKQKDGDNPLKDSESFKRPYAAVLLQLNEVSSALSRLRQRNTYQGISSPTLSKPVVSPSDPDGRASSLGGSYYNIRECGSQVAEIVESSRMRAQKLVGAALQAISSLEKMGKNLERVEEAIDFVNNRLLEEDFSMPAVRNSTHKDSVVTPSEQLPASASTVSATSPTPDPKLNSISNQNEPNIPSELIARCVAALLMIQKCTERPFPPAEVAQVLDSALTSLQPLCSQNLSLYEEIQKFMGIIRTQILALIPR